MEMLQVVLSRLWIGGLAAAGLGVLAALAVGAAPATAAPPAILNISPANQAVIKPGSDGKAAITFRYGCPTYTTSYGSTRTYTGYYVSVVDTLAYGDPAGVSSSLLSGLSGSTSEGSGVCRSSTAQRYPSGTYYWQVDVADCDYPSCSRRGPVWRFTVPRIQSMTKSQAMYYTKRILKDNTSSLKRYESKCFRKSRTSFICGAAWEPSRRSFVVGKATVRHIFGSNGETTYWTGKFKGRLYLAKCGYKKSCSKKLTWY